MSAPQSQRKVQVGVLGATGTVGQRFIVLLSSHPYFVIRALGASSRSAGQKYKDAVRWKQSVPIPKSVEDVEVRECKADQFEGCDIVFSGLDSDAAGDIEKAFRAAELAVFSNAGNYRRDPQCPLIVPLVNPEHFNIIPAQQKALSLSKGFIKAFGPLETVMVTTMQAISGAGYPGVSSLDILDNVVPLIGGEEEKMEWELSKILGGLSDDKAAFALRHDSKNPLAVSAACNRVPVLDGHLECASVRFAVRPPPSLQAIKDALRAFRSEAQDLGCPSAPQQAIFVHDQPDRPQPRLDRYFQNGSGVNVGRIRECPVLDIKFVCLVNNVSIGAATSSIINAEYAVAKEIV
ncbi:semialdehyde dehydrogenase [Leucosporidium creatinivorum]|uniref:Aspartate-semialdehyde dehydrogenase n=1 Tax=Leucosporidium creatinivorum TaxID=106004 RepID=A0A1Y2FFZ9_9BASI|nr:semialdehyde dehydrogenase [Leucosporidium creatinivorum]